MYVYAVDMHFHIIPSFYGCKGTMFFRMLQYLKIVVSTKYLVMVIKNQARITRRLAL